MNIIVRFSCVSTRACRLTSIARVNFLVPCQVVKFLPLIFWSGIRKSNLRMPELQISCNYLTKVRAPNWSPEAPFTNMVLTSIPVWRSNQVPIKVWDEITCPFPNFNGCTVEVWGWISDSIPHFMINVITYPCWDYSWIMLVKGAPGRQFFVGGSWIQ